MAWIPASVRALNVRPHFAGRSSSRLAPSDIPRTPRSVGSSMRRSPCSARATASIGRAVTLFGSPIPYSGGTARGGYGTIMMENIYMEDTGSCPNPQGNIGGAGVIMQGSKLSFRGGEGPSGHMPQFAKTGATRYEYFLVARHPKYGASNPLYAGFAMTNGTDSITVTTSDVPGADTFDLLRVLSRGGRMEAPNGTGAFLIAAKIP